METATLTKATNTSQRQDIYELVTNTIIQQLEAGVIPWQKPWTVGTHFPLTIPKNFVTKNRYNGINILLLWSAGNEKNFETNDWASFKQWQSKNELVRKGEKGNLVVYYDTFEKEKDGEIQKIPFLKSSYVFNRCQLSSYEAPLKEPNEIQEPLYTVIEPVEEFIGNTNAVIVHGGDKAAYSRSEDKILMPKPENFQFTASCTATEGYYSTLCHELIHWSGSPQRLDRIKGKKFGDQNYAVEELVAEFGAAFLCAGFGIATLDKGGHAGYIDHWLKVIKENNRCLFTAASEASKAVKYLEDLQPTG